tara:strand:- start:14 stop:628 length:615 start_codon:yes stop_codon:yes gene_type:complete
MSIVKLNNRGVRSVTAFGSATSGSMTFIKKLTASSSSTLSFVDGSSDVVLDNTYKEYLFTYKNMHRSNGTSFFQFDMSVDGGSNYNLQKTTTFFYTYHNEGGGGDTTVGYVDGWDKANGTGSQRLSNGNNANDESTSGYLRLFNPSSTTFVKHFMARSISNNGVYLEDNYAAGYANTTSAVDAIKFEFSSGNIDTGDICLYGIN